MAAVTNRTIIQKYLDRWRDRLIEEYDKRGFRASGKFAEELEGRATEYSGVLLSSPHVEFMNRGRGPTTTFQANEPPLREIIEQWTIDKGINPEKGQTRESLAFAITQKIHREGYNVTGREGLVEAAIPDSEIDALLEELTVANGDEIFTAVVELFQDFKQFAA